MSANLENDKEFDDAILKAEFAAKIQVGANTKLHRARGTNPCLIDTRVTFLNANARGTVRL